jgi:hypothetical protein
MSAASGNLARRLEHTLLRPEASAADKAGRLGTSASLAILAGA